MKINFAAIEKFAAECQAQPETAIKKKQVSGECNFAEGPHFTATIEFANGKITVPTDQPPFMGGGGNAPDPLQYCLYGLASCFAGTMMLIIGQRQLKVTQLDVSAWNQVNLLKPLGLAEKPIVERVGLSMKYSGTATQDEMNSVVAEALETCPGAYCVRNPMHLETTISKGN